MSRTISSQYGHRCVERELDVFIGTELMNIVVFDIYARCLHDQVVYLDIRKRRRRRKKECEEKENDLFDKKKDDDEEEEGRLKQFDVDM